MLRNTNFTGLFWLLTRWWIQSLSLRPWWFRRASRTPSLNLLYNIICVIVALNLILHLNIPLFVLQGHQILLLQLFYLLFVLLGLNLLNLLHQLLPLSLLLGYLFLLLIFFPFLLLFLKLSLSFLVLQILVKSFSKFMIAWYFPCIFNLSHMVLFS